MRSDLSCGSPRQQFNDATLIPSADGHSVPIQHEYKRLSFDRISSNLFYELQIHDGGPVYTNERFGVKLTFKIRHRFAKKMALLFRADTHVIFFCSDPTNVGNREK